MKLYSRTMKLYSSDKTYRLYHGSMLDMLDVIEPKSIDSIVTDPPYELNFMNKGWDNSGIAFQKETWRNCYKALKPGGYLLAFGGSRTFHRIAVAIEDRGFEIRDVIMWLYGSGFPKSMNIGLAIDKKNGVDNRTGYIRKDGQGTDSGSMIYNSNNGQNNMTQYFEERLAQNEWSGWGTALKPSYEPIIIARKPVEGSVVDNVIKYGVGGINIDECRVGDDGGVMKTNIEPHSQSKNSGFGCNGKLEDLGKGRFPSNTILTYDETDEEEVCGGFPDTKGAVRMPTGKGILDPNTGWNNNSMIDCTIRGFDDEGSASRYFYCAKASKKDRDDGLFEFDVKSSGRLTERKEDSDGITAFTGSRMPKRNNHPTVKPTELMQYLVRLVTPKNGTVLDPFNGSGSTGKAVMYENKERESNYKYIGIDLSDEYLAISKARIEYAEQDNIIQVTKNGDIFEQKSLFEDIDL